MGLLSLAVRRPFVALAVVVALGLAFLAVPSGEAAAPKNSQDLVAMWGEVKDSVAPACGCQLKGDEVAKFTRELEGAESLDAARAKAIEQSQLVKRAVDVAEGLRPVREMVQPIRLRLDTFEAQVNAAGSQMEVAQAFERLVNKGEPNVDQIKRKKGCDITMAELIVIIIGFLLAILPGVILLILFC